MFLKFLSKLADKVFRIQHTYLQVQQKKLCTDFFCFSGYSSVLNFVWCKTLCFTLFHRFLKRRRCQRNRAFTTRNALLVSSVRVALTTQTPQRDPTTRYVNPRTDARLISFASADVVTPSTCKARFRGTQFRGKAPFRGQRTHDDATVFTVRGKLELEDKFFVKIVEFA